MEWNVPGAEHATVFFQAARSPCYLRVRGSSGDAEPTPDVVGQANPFEDLWMYANPIFVDVC